jgi:hypothetical protein
MVLHIGLPKTATTFLQHSIFRWMENVTYVHRRYGEQWLSFTRALKQLRRVHPRSVRGVSERLAQEFRQILAAGVEGGQPPRIIVSDENISLAASEFWVADGPGPRQVAERLQRALRGMGLGEGAVKVVLGIRRQDQWFASRYAQSAASFPEFGQEDFDRRIESVCGMRLRGPLEWIDYAAVHGVLTRAFGAGNVFFMPMEALRHSPQATLGELGRFFGGIDLLEIYQRRVVEGKSRRGPSLSVGPNVWRLRKRTELITLSEERGRMLLERFRDSNRALAKATGLDLSGMGYC